MKISRICFILAFITASSSLFAEEYPLLDAVLAREASRTDKPAKITPAPEKAARDLPAMAPGKTTEGIPAAAPKKTSTDIFSPAPKKAAKDLPALNPSEMAKALPLAGPSAKMAPSDQESPFDRSAIWVGVGQSESEYENGKFEHDSGLSATLGLSFGLTRRWSLDILGNYRSNKVVGYDDEEDLDHFDGRGLLRFALFQNASLRLYAAGGGMYGQSDIPYRDYYTSSYWGGWWWGWRSRRHWYSDISTATIAGGLLGGGAEFLYKRFSLHASMLSLIGGSTDTEDLWNDCNIGEGKMLSVDAQYALTESLRIGVYYQDESFGDGETSIDLETLGAMVGLAF